MPIYAYHAISTDFPGDDYPPGGCIWARDRAEAKSKLKKRGLLPTQLKRLSVLQSFFVSIGGDIEWVLGPRPQFGPFFDRMKQLWQRFTENRPREPEVRNDEPMPTPEPSNARILIQHCDGMLGMMYGDMLNRVGYQMVTYVSHHPEAIQKAKECDFDLVILDIVSPAGPPYGAEATAEIRAHYADRGGVAILGVSTWISRAREFFMENGADAFLLAPFRHEEFQLLVTALLTGSPIPSEYTNPVSTPPIVYNASPPCLPAEDCALVTPAFAAYGPTEPPDVAIERS